MRLIGELARERATPALVNLHDVALARSFSDRIVGFKAGTVAFDGTPAELTDDVLTLIYGAEDWNPAAGQADADGDVGADSGAAGITPRANAIAAKGDRQDLAAQP
jgi:phosphonate transport system ATP-binding protein